VPENTAKVIDLTSDIVPRGLDSVDFAILSGADANKFTLKGNSFEDLRINRNNHQKPTFHPLGDFLNPALVLLGQGLKKSPIGQKLDFTNHPYLCKGL
jgi:hypothetical protein